MTYTNIIIIPSSSVEDMSTSDSDEEGSDSSLEVIGKNGGALTELESESESESESDELELDSMSYGSNLQAKMATFPELLSSWSP